MRTRPSSPRRALNGRYLAGLALLCCLLSLQSWALWPEDRQRLHVGLKLFPACLGADQSLGSKVTPEGEILVLVVYQEEPGSAQSVVAGLRQVEKIGELPFRVQILAADQMLSYEGPRAAGIFLASPDIGGSDLESWAERFHALVFSPFIGDVERGAVAGIFVAERILPFVNLAQARRAGVRFKPFFLKVAKLYE